MSAVGLPAPWLLGRRSVRPAAVLVDAHAEVKPARVLVPLDGTPESESVLPLAARWATHAHVPLHLVSVLPPGSGAAARAAGAPAGDLNEAAYVLNVARRLRAQGYRATTEVLHGRRARRAIRSEAEAVPGTLVLTAKRRLRPA